MKFLIIVFIAVCLVKLSKGYLCYECNSTYDKNCFDFSPKSYSVHKGVYCDMEETGGENCYSVHISDRKTRRFYRGCKKAGICNEYETQENSNIHYKVLTCSECYENNCNASDSLVSQHHLAIMSFYAVLSFIVRTILR